MFPELKSLDFAKVTEDEKDSARLQIIVNNYHNQVEELNEELVKELLTKDELQIEQDGQLVDIEDLSSSFSRLQ